MRALIVDDERLARNELKRLLATHPEIEVCGEASHVDEALELIQQLSPGLLFLDIQMPGGTGFDLLTQLDECPLVIFTTAYDEHAIRAFEVNALDYLVKPLEPERLELALRKARDQSLLQPPPPRRLTVESRVFVKDGQRCWFVSLRQVRLLESEGNYTRVYFGGHSPLVYRSLTYLDQRLDPAAFFRASRRHIIGLRWVARIRSGSGSLLIVELEGGLQVEMSRRRGRQFQEKMKL